jgi:hypothetical protein
MALATGLAHKEYQKIACLGFSLGILREIRN